MTVREVLDVASVRVRTELSSQPELQAALQTLLGRLYLQLGEYEPAMRQAEDSLERRRQLHREGHPAISESRILIARVLLGQGELDAAEKEATEVLTIQRAGADDLAIDEMEITKDDHVSQRGTYIVCPLAGRD